MSVLYIEREGNEHSNGNIDTGGERQRKRERIVARAAGAAQRSLTLTLHTSDRLH